MALQKRPSPAGKPVSLFVTCMIDMLYPDTGMAVVEVLEHLGAPVSFPMGQTCCGQPGFNAGYRAEARRVALRFLDSFSEAEVIVTPSGSCAAMVRHEYPVLFSGEPELLVHAERLASITWEFTEYLVDGLGITDLAGTLPAPLRCAFHDACHGLRLLGIGSQGRTLVSNLGNAEVVELSEREVCCGFGGLFSVKMPAVSGAMLLNKMASIEASPADCVLTCDASFMTHLNGGLARAGSEKRVRHVADFLAESIRGLP